MALKVERDRLLSPRNLERLVEIYHREGSDFAPARPDRLIFERPAQDARAVRR
jgi:hypothetical protein